jgi:hypothetical protein
MIERDSHATQVISKDSNSTKKAVNVLTEGKHESRSIRISKITRICCVWQLWRQGSKAVHQSCQTQQTPVTFLMRALSRCSHTSISRHMDLLLAIVSRPTGALWFRRILWIREARLKMLVDVHDRLSSLSAELLTPVGTHQQSRALTEEVFYCSSVASVTVKSVS